MRAVTWIAVLSAVVWSGCSEGDPTASTSGAEASPGFSVVSGDRSCPVDVTGSSQKTQDDIVRAVKQLWDGLQPGRSVEFRVEGRSTLDVHAEGRRVGDDGTPPKTATTSGHAQITTRSTPYRLFKDRDGASGIEEAVEKPTGPELRSGPAIGWAEIEEDLRERAFSTYSLDALLPRHPGR